MSFGYGLRTAFLEGHTHLQSPQPVAPFLNQHSQGKISLPSEQRDTALYPVNRLIPRQHRSTASVSSGLSEEISQPTTQQLYPLNKVASAPSPALSQIHPSSQYLQVQQPRAPLPEMATSVLPQGPSHFGGNPNVYPQGLFGDYSAQSNPTPSYQLHTDEEHSSFQNQRRWSGQQAFRRPSSRSPNFRDRTPIHHHRASLSRPRSTSRPEAMLAYANEQSLEQQQQSHPPQQTQHSQPDASNTLYAAQLPPYINPAVSSPYLHQQSVFEHSTHPNGPYTQFPNYQDTHRTGEYYTLARPELQLPAVSSATLNPSDTLFNQARAPHLPSMSAMPLNFAPIAQPLESTPADMDVVGSRQKPQCWDHGCNGRQFSTFSNLLRHQREKSGTASKARCPHCGTEFTRTTARNGHLYGGKCKGIAEGGKKSPSDTSDGK